MFSAIPEGISASSGTEASVAAAMSAAAAAHAPILTGALPMGLDPTSAEFAAALNAAGGSYLAVHGVEAANRGEFSADQQLAAGTITATEAIRAATASL
jgi:hypothetical protein